MLESDGGEGPIGAEGYLRLWPIAHVLEQPYGAYAGHVLIGTNGGGEGIAIRVRDGAPEVVLLPLIGATSDALAGGRTLAEFLETYGSGAIWKLRR
jgi:hypothetical protein